VPDFGTESSVIDAPAAFASRAIDARDGAADDVDEDAGEDAAEDDSRAPAAVVEDGVPYAVAPDPIAAPGIDD
jgi:hypothetical protein